ncbi:ABC transporter permease [Streptomyces oceani]|uniref:Transport permease protein n=1 Tax=Streptomyces oceani TaxID=1075402 RepID=A0A1E7KEY5_9ACTN|nr:ABC transporter permease [Streptomyces oceani]OEV02478.1 ABC transporter [Streptomyces oceani]
MAPQTPTTAAPQRSRARGNDGGRIGLRANLRHTGALARRNAVQIKQHPELMMDSLMIPIVFTLLFVYVFGGAMGGGSPESASENRDAYTNYLVPGIMAMMSLTMAMSVGTGINEDSRKGIMDRFRAMPIARASVLVAKCLVEMCRLLLSLVVLVIVGFLVGMDIEGRWMELGAAMGLTLFFGTSLLWVFMLMGLTMRTAQAVQGVSFLVTTPLQFGSSVFVPTDTMPAWMETFTKFNPLTHVADANRALTMGTGEVANPVMWAVIWSVGIIAVIMPLAIVRFRKRT